MAAVNSTMVPLGSDAPDFALLDTVSWRTMTLDDVSSDVATVIMFICNHCPFVKHINPELARLSADYQAQGVSFVAISANDVGNYPDDAPDLMHALVKENGFGFPYLYDETQAVAKAYDAQCTPDFFVYDGDLKLAYRGQLDDSRPRNGLPVTGADLRAALDALLAGDAVAAEQKPSIGCNIKWRD